MKNFAISSALAATGIAIQACSYTVCNGAEANLSKRKTQLAFLGILGVPTLLSCGMFLAQRKGFTFFSDRLREASISTAGATVFAIAHSTFYYFDD